MNEEIKAIITIFYEKKYEELNTILEKLSKNELINLYSKILEYYGGSTATGFILKSYRYFFLLNKEDIKNLLSIMNHNLALGRDTLIEFYALHTKTEKSSFDFIDNFNDYRVSKLFDIDKNQEPEEYKGYIINRNVLQQNRKEYNILSLSEKDIKIITTFELL